ncbi:MAG: hypothetical protein WCO69_06905 [Candidatus Omnitrophota bacterium]
MKLNDKKWIWFVIFFLMSTASSSSGDVLSERDSQTLNRITKSFEDLVAEGESLEKSGDYFEAHRLYSDMPPLFAGRQAVINLKYRSLMELGATSLARDLILSGQVAIDPAILKNLEGDEAMARIRWNEPAQADKLLAREASEPSSSLRAVYDRIAVLRQQEQMTEVIALYLQLKANNSLIPLWTQTQVADAYLYLRSPETALTMYQDALAHSWDPGLTTSISIYYTLVELGRYSEAEPLLARLEKEAPDQIVLRGLLRDNGVKEEVVANGAWSMLYQDRLLEGARRFDALLARAPFNTNLRTALGQAYLWRGWPRLALEELRISGTMDPVDLKNRIALTYAWDENDQGEMARGMARELMAANPKNLNVSRLARHFKLEDMRTLTIMVSCGLDRPGAHDLEGSVRIDQPILPWRSIFASYLWHRSRADGVSGLSRRYLLGTDWRLGRDWWTTLGASINESGRDPGHFESLSWTPDDHWRLTGAYDSFAADLPPKAVAQGVDADERTFSLRYRSSEVFTAEGYARFRGYNDGNKQDTQGLRLDRALTTSAFWKTRLAIDGYREINSRLGTIYFSPEEFYSVYAVPMLEHVWSRRYERSWTDRLFLGLGRQWQKGYGWDNGWYGRYEDEHVLSDRLMFLWGVTVSQKSYDGTMTDGWSVDAKLRYKF